MSIGGKRELTSDEIIATLSHSMLPTVVVEGKDDIVVYRELEEICANMKLSVFPVGGRMTVLQIFERRSEITQQTKVAFIADRDIWILTGVPTAYDDKLLVLTSGYSIENDVFQDGNLINFMSQAEAQRFSEEIKLIVHWFALVAARFIAGESEKISLHPSEVLESTEKRIDALILREGERYPSELYDRISSDYAKYLRGKTLIAVLMRHLSYPGRFARHNHRAILEMVANHRGDLLNSLFGQVRALFS